MLQKATCSTKGLVVHPRHTVGRIVWQLAQGWHNVALPAFSPHPHMEQARYGMGASHYVLEQWTPGDNRMSQGSKP